jgi:ribose 5-phosphate isomerase B
MRIALGADHAGVVLKEHVKRLLDDLHVAYEDFGTATDTSVDYPDFAAHVAREVASGGFDRGILMCSSGLGMAIAANKIRGIRAVPVSDVDSARLAREHNDANVLALGGRLTSVEQAKEVVRIFLETPFAGGRHQRRIDKIAELELPEGTSTSSEQASKADVANKKI